MRTIDVALDLFDAHIPVAGLDATGVVKVPVSTDRRAVCAAFRDGQPHIPAGVLGNGLVTIRFHGDEPYRRTVEGIRARDSSLFNLLALLRSPSGHWIVRFRAQGSAAPAGEVLARDKAGKVLVELLADGDLVLFGGQDAPVWRQGNLKAIPTLPHASVDLLLEAARSVNEAAEVEPEPVIKATSEGATAEAAPAPETVEAPQAEARQAAPDLPDLQTPAGFLALLYPDAAFDGWLTFFTKAPDGRTATAAFPRSKLADAEKWAFAQATAANVWHGVCLRKEKPAKNKRGQAEDVIAIPGVWLDLDVKGPGHSEQNLPATFEEALDFLASLPLKPTLIVFTGGGLQPYWLFPEPMRLSTEADWNRAKAVSERWQRFIIAMGKDRGWKLDNTSDLPRVLRLPGTWNRKTDTPRLVTVPAEHVDLTARYDLAAVEAVLPPVETPQAEPNHAEAHDDVADADIKLILPKCAWARHCRDDAAALPEPEWYSILSILARCKDGARLAHEMSKAHSKYNPAETDAKLKQAMDKAGPRTCESIKANFGTYCNGCSEHVTSPIVLGRPYARRTENCRPVGFDDCAPPSISPDILPGILRAFPLALSESIQVPYELALINALGAVAVAAQRKFRVMVKPGYAEPINIYALCALPPGERKSSTVEACKRPLVEWQAAKRQEMRDDIRDAESERKTIEKTIETKRTKAAAVTDESRRDMIEEIKRMERALPEIPVVPRLLADDATPEALAALLERQDERIGMLEAEGGFFDTLAGRYSNGIPNLDLILKGWCGEPTQVDRKGRDAIFLKSPLLTLVISPQPEIVQGLATRPGFRGRGLVGRFLYILPQSRLGGREIETIPVPATLLYSWRDTLFRLLETVWAVGEDGEKASHGIGLTLDALDLWKRFATLVEAGLLPGGEFEYMSDWAGKFPGQAIRLAGLIHVATAADPLAPIDCKTMSSALSVAAILAEHAKAAYGLMGSDPAQECAKAILRWIERDRVATFTARDALRAVRGRFPTMEKIIPGLNILEERAFIFEASGESRRGPGRKPSAAYIVNPKTWGEV